MNHHVEVGIMREGEVAGMALLVGPLTFVAVVAHHDVVAVAELEAHIKVHGHLAAAAVALHVDGEPGDKRIVVSVTCGVSPLSGFGR